MLGSKMLIYNKSPKSVLYSLPKIKSFIQISMLIAEGLDFFFFIR